MSYSRWITSYWYTYYKAREDDSWEIDKQLFCIDGNWTFTYKELKKNMKKCLNKIKEDIKDNSNRTKKPTEEDFKELRRYMKAFMYDAEHQEEWRNDYETLKNR